MFLFLLAHDTQPVFFGSVTPQILAAKFSGSTLNVVTQWLPSFQHEQKQIIVFINSCCGDAPTQADSKDRTCVTFRQPVDLGQRGFKVTVVQPDQVFQVTSV